MSELEKLKAQNAELNDRIAKLEKAAEPPKPFVPRPMPRRDLTEGMSMDRATMLEFARAAGSTAAEDLRAFNNKNDPNHPQQSLNANVVQVGVTKRHWALPPALSWQTD